MEVDGTHLQTVEESRLPRGNCPLPCDVSHVSQSPTLLLLFHGRSEGRWGTKSRDYEELKLSLRYARQSFASLRFALRTERQTFW